MYLTFLIPLTLPFHVLGVFVAHFCVLVISWFSIGFGRGLGLMVIVHNYVLRLACFAVWLGVGYRVFFPHWTGLVVWASHSVWI